MPEETFEEQYQELCRKLFEEIEEKKNHYKRLEEASKNRYRDELESRRMKDQYRIVTEEEWETSRHERVNSWKSWSEKIKKTEKVGAKKVDKSFKPPSVKPEERNQRNPPPAYNDIEPIKRLW